MANSDSTTARQLENLRQNNPAWQLLASRRAPLILSALSVLFQGEDGRNSFEDVVQLLSETFAEHGNDESFSSDVDFYKEARRELRDWIRRRLVVERDGQISATDELQQVQHFVEGIQNRIMTSTGSRLSMVQQGIEDLAVRLDPDLDNRKKHLEGRIARLEDELERVRRGKVSVLEGKEAVEGIRDIFDLAMSLRADFRSVEDSYRLADQQLRQSIINDSQHRGQVVDRLLDGHDALLNTAEGQVFNGFYQQLRSAVELDQMQQRLRQITMSDAAVDALTRQQLIDLRNLITRLNSESREVLRARARGERDVKGFLKTGLAAEHHRIGQQLNMLFETALSIDWEKQNIRRADGPLRCIAINLSGLPAPQRIRFKEIDTEEDNPLELMLRAADLADIDDNFWQAFDSLDRQALLDQTRSILNQTKQSMSISELSQYIPASHDLEHMAFWVNMAQQAEALIHDQIETFEITNRDGQKFRFSVPLVALSAQATDQVEWE